jgi:hypothetical protein
VGGDADFSRTVYTFKFGCVIKRMQLTSMEPTQWDICPHNVASGASQRKRKRTRHSSHHPIVAEQVDARDLKRAIETWLPTQPARDKERASNIATLLIANTARTF